MNLPIVSIIMTTYNGNVKWVSEAIESVLNQKYPNKELIIVDDGSTNSTGKIIVNYMERYDNVFYMKNGTNIGCSKSSNVGIKYSKGKYIARIDDDDIWNDDEKIEKQVRFMELNPDYGLVGVKNIIILNEEGNSIGMKENRITDYDIRKHILQSNQFTHSSILFRRESLERVGLYNEDYYAALDYEIICRVGEFYKFANLEGVSVSYRINTKGITKKKYSLQYRNAWKVFLSNRNKYPNFGKAFFLRVIDFFIPICARDFLLLYLKKYHIID